MADLGNIAPPSPPSASPPTAPASPSGRRKRNILIGAVALAVAAVVAFVFVIVGGAKKGGEVLLEPTASTGPFPWTASVANAKAPTSVPLPSASSSTSAGGKTVLTAVSGDRVGIYGGSMEMSVCDKNKLVGFLSQNPAQASAFASVLGITPSGIPSYVASLTPVLLGADTRVTNHGYSNGTPTPRQSILQAGTAVLIDTYGMPRVKCYCGNPLLPPRPVSGTPRYTGPAWPGFNPATIVVVRPAAQPMTQVTVINVATGQPTVIQTGTGTVITTGQPPSPGQPTAPGQSTAPLPTYVPPAPQPGYTAPTNPQPSTVLTYQLTGITTTHTYGGNIAGAGTNAVSPGTQQVSVSDRLFTLGWDYMWPGDNPINRNRAMADISMTDLPTVLRSDTPGRFSAVMRGEWITSGYAVPRDHTLSLGGAVGTQNQDFAAEPSSQVGGSISSSGTYQTSGIYGNSFTITITAGIRFGDDHTGQLDVVLTYTRTS